MGLKRLAPFFYKYLKIEKRGQVDYKNLLTSFLVCGSFAFLNSFLTVLVSSRSGIGMLIPCVLSYYTLFLYSTKIMAFAGKLGKVVFVTSSTIGYLLAVYLFN